MGSFHHCQPPLCCYPVCFQSQTLRSSTASCTPWNSVLLLKTSLPAEPFSKFWNKSSPGKQHLVLASWPLAGGARTFPTHMLSYSVKNVFILGPLWPWTPPILLSQPNLLAGHFLILHTPSSRVHCACPLAPSTGTIQIWMSPLERGGDAFCN